MKRSRTIMLTSLMAGAGVSLTACDGNDPGGKPVDALSYTSVAACKADGQMTPEACDKAYADAQKANEANAPRFDQRQSCEEQYGVDQCVPRNNGSFFTPLLTGFIVGQALNNLGGGGYRGAPMYRDRYGSYYGGGGVPFGRNYVNGRTRIGSDAFNPAVRAPTRVQSRSAVISRGGFGGGFGGRGFGG